MTPEILVDTDVLIDYLRDHPQAIRFVESHAEALQLSVINVAEIWAGVRGAQEQQKIETLFETFPILNITPRIAKRAGDWMRTYFKSHALAMPDALIAATALENNLELKTLNVGHFPMFKGLAPPYRRGS